MALRKKKGKDLSPWTQLCMVVPVGEGSGPLWYFYASSSLQANTVNSAWCVPSYIALIYLIHDPLRSFCAASVQGWMQSIRILIAFCLSKARYLLPLKMENVQDYLSMFSFGRSLNFCNGREWENQNMLNKSPSLEMLLWQQHFLMPVKRACSFKTSHMWHDFLTEVCYRVCPPLLWFYVPLVLWISFAGVEQWIWICCVCPPNLIRAVEVKKVL